MTPPFTGRSTLSPGGPVRSGEPPEPVQRTTGDAEAAPAPVRLRSIDALRGLAIFVMLVTMNPGDRELRPAQFHHPDWHGLSFIDLFFPLFLFVMGMSMTLSRRALDVRHVLRRAGILFALGVGLATLKYERFVLTGVLQHIAGSYVLAFLVLRAPRKRQLPIVVGLVAAVGAGFVLWAWGSDPWGQSDTLAHAVDGALFGSHRTEGALPTVMSTATIVGGAFAGRLLQATQDLGALVRRLLVRAGWLVGLALLLAPVVPVNKRLWTPSFTVLTLGTSFALLAAGVWMIDMRRLYRPVAPLVHVGTNPIAVYVLFMAALALLNNYGEGLTPTFEPAGYPTLGFVTYAAGWTTIWWLLAYVLYRRRIFVKV